MQNIAKLATKRVAKITDRGWLIDNNLFPSPWRPSNTNNKLYYTEEDLIERGFTIT